MIFANSPINFRITRGKYCVFFKENSWDFWNQLIEVLKVDEILEKLQKNVEEI